MPCTTRRHRSLVAAAAILICLSLGACGDDGDTDAGTGDVTTTGASGGDVYDSGGRDTGSTDGGTAAEGTIVAADFSLTDVTVAPGAELVLQNEGSATHTATADDGSFDSGEVAGGETSDPVAAPDEPGSYPFHCEIHSGMTATLTVEG